MAVFMNERDRSWQPWLLCLLALALAPRAIDQIVGASLATTLRHFPGHTWLPLFTAAAEVLGLVMAGVALDRRGLRVTVAAALAFWAALLATCAALANAPLALFLVHEGSIVAGVVFGLAVPVAAKLAFPMARRARVLAVLNVSAVVWLLLIPSVSTLIGWPPKPVTSGSGLVWIDWPTGCFIASGFAAVLAAAWWSTARRPDRTSDESAPRAQGHASFAETMALFRRPGIWALVAVMTCHMLVLGVLHRVLFLYMHRERLMPLERIVQSVAIPLAVWAVAQIAFATWSDRRARRSERPAAARAPFVLVGTILSSSIGLIPFLSRDAAAAIYWMLALGMAAFGLVFPLAFDTVPRALAGRFCGTATAIALAVSTALFVIAMVLGSSAHSVVWYLYLAGIASLVAAAVTWTKLRTLEPIEDNPDLIGTIVRVFA